MSIQSANLFNQKLLSLAAEGSVGYTAISCLKNGTPLILSDLILTHGLAMHAGKNPVTLLPSRISTIHHNYPVTTVQANGIAVPLSPGDKHTRQIN